MSKQVSKRVLNRTTCCPNCTKPVLPEVNALFNHLLESHYSKQQRTRETCVLQSAHICTANLCVRRSVEDIVAKLPRVAAPAAAQPPAPDPPIQPPPVALLLPPPMSAPTPPGVAQGTLATTSVPQQDPQLLIILVQRLAALEASVAANARAAEIAAEQARATAAATTEQVSQEKVDSHFSINCRVRARLSTVQYSNRSMPWRLSNEMQPLQPRRLSGAA